jgi:mannose/fructose/N-acetylgalactosamine-specific phosphotransferase system component IIB
MVREPSKTVNSADEEMKALDSLDSKNVAIINQKVSNKKYGFSPKTV